MYAAETTMETKDDKSLVFAIPAVLSDGNGGFGPCPELLTEEEAIKYLRLDIDGPAKPENTLRYYRERKKLKGTRIGKRILYTRKALDEFLERMTQ
jgi:hypothetical protein